MTVMVVIDTREDYTQEFASLDTTFIMLLQYFNGVFLRMHLVLIAAPVIAIFHVIAILENEWIDSHIRMDTTPHKAKRIVTLGTNTSTISPLEFLKRFRGITLSHASKLAVLDSSTFSSLKTPIII
jgi:hypothetical protein